MTPEQIEAALGWAKQGVEHYEKLSQDNKVCPAGSETAKIIHERLMHNQCAVFTLRLALRVMGEPSEGMLDAMFDQISGDEEGRCSAVDNFSKDIFTAMRDRLIEEVRDDR